MTYKYIYISQTLDDTDGGSTSPPSTYPVMSTLSPREILQQT